MQQGSDKSGFHTNRNMVGTGVILHKVYEISCIIHKQPFRRPNMRIMPETRISSSQPVLWRVSVAGTLVAPWWHSGSVAEDRTGSGGGVPVLHYPALRCACVCLYVCLYVCKANGQAAGNNMDGSEPLVLCRQTGLGGPWQRPL